MDKKSRVNKYTPEGRAEIHKNLSGVNMAVLYHLMNNPCGKQSVEYNDNRIALYIAQKGNVLSPVWNWKRIRWTATIKSRWC